MPPGERHSSVEYLVFGLALLLMLALAYEGVKRVLPMLSGAGAASTAATPGNGAPEKHELVTSGTYRAPSYVSTVKVRPGGPAGRRKTGSVPSPADSR